MNSRIVKPTIIPRARVRYEMVHRQRGALRRGRYHHLNQQAQVEQLFYLQSLQNIENLTKKIKSPRNHAYAYYISRAWYNGS